MVAVVPSPKVQAKEVTVPTGALEAEALKVVGEPGAPGVTENEGRWGLVRRDGDAEGVAPGLDRRACGIGGGVDRG